MAAYRALGGSARGHPLRLVGDARVFRAFGRLDDATVVPVGDSIRQQQGVADPRNAPAVIAAIDEAVAQALDGRAAAVVTAPIHKSSLMQAGFRFPGHTEYLQQLTGARAVMMLAGGGLRVVPLTIHIPLAEVPEKITRELIVETFEILLAALASDFGIAHPRIAVAGLNPHAGEEGRLGTTELTTIAPACEALRGNGFNVAGPLSADTMFHAEARTRFDAALCMYHDQALIPFKTLAFWEGVNVTLGLPIVRTSPDHGTALDIAGSGRADPRSMIAAIELAADIADARKR
jgi:4-hydroxythreonine-4-phosphate dehydrogenase